MFLFCFSVLTLLCHNPSSSAIHRTTGSRPTVRCTYNKPTVKKPIHACESVSLVVEVSEEAKCGDRTRFAVVTKQNALTLNGDNGIKTREVLMSSCAQCCGSHGTVGIH